MSRKSRKTERHNSAINKYHSDGFDGYPRFYMSDLACAFETGAEWADEHPNKNLVNINEVVSWIKVNIPNYYGYGMIFPEIINDFKKAMKR